MRHKTLDVSAAKPEEGSLELTEELIRVRAYRFYEERDANTVTTSKIGSSEAEIIGKKTCYCLSKGRGRREQAGRRVRGYVGSLSSISSGGTHAPARTPALL